MELTEIKSKGVSWGQAADDLNQNFSKVNNAVEQVKNATTRNKGYFSSEAALKSAFKSASFGDIAYVGSAFPYQTWAWNGSEWVKKNDNGGQESVNLGNYYTKSETDGKFTEADAKLSELGSEEMVKMPIESTIVDYYINNKGQWVNTIGQYLCFWKVNKGDFIVLVGGSNAVYCNYAIFSNIPNIGDSPLYFEGSPKDFIRAAVMPYDGYVCCAENGASAMYKSVNITESYTLRKKETEDAINLSNSEIVELKDIHSTIEDYYVNNRGMFVGVNDISTRLYSVSKGELLLIDNQGLNDNHAKYAFYEELPTIDSLPCIFESFSEDKSNYVVSPIDGYIALSNGDKAYTYLYKLSKNDFNTFNFTYLEKQPEYIIRDYFLNSEGLWRSQEDQFTCVFKVAKGDRIKTISGSNTYYAAWAFYKNAPSIDDLPKYYRAWVDDNSSYWTVIEDGYIVVSNGVNPAHLYVNEDINTWFDSYKSSTNEKEKITKSIVSFDYVNAITREQDGIIEGAYINKDGMWINLNGQIIYYWSVKKGDVANVVASRNENYAAWAFYKEIPNENSIPYAFAPYKDLSDEYAVAPIDGYLVTSNNLSESPITYYEPNINSSLFEGIRSVIGKTFVEKADYYGIIEDYYINADGNWISLEGNNVKYWKVSKGDMLKIFGGSNMYYAAWALFEDIPNINTQPYKYRPWKDSSNGYIPVCPIDGYIAVGGYKFEEYLFKLEENIVVSSGSKKYENRTCLYIGDSISTANNYQWKGFIEQNYSLKYVRDKSNELAPANGGITVIPPITESENNEQKSIWYRCANQRMNIYNFDIISLFGGTNDMTNENLNIGSENDIAYVDDASLFNESDNVTDVRPDNLSFASALKGCILMLKRDYPNKEIILPTVMPCGSIYGNWTDANTGLIASEAIANLQLRIATMYNIKAIPFYWDMRTSTNASNNWSDKYGVHPNMQGALRMQAILAQTLCL